MKKLLLSVGIIIFLGTIVAGGTSAFFSDTETSSGNIFTAGGIDLKIDNESYYNGALNDETSWGLTDLDGELFFNFLDLKPGDWGEDTISIHVDNNDSWACMSIDLTATDDNGLTEPEKDDGDNTDGDGEGELQNHINFVWWSDDGDNVLEDDEANDIFQQSSLSELDGLKIALADSTGNGIFGANPLEGSDDYHIGKAWCFGDLILAPVTQDGLGKEGNNGPLDRGSGVTCSGASDINNVAQTDSVEGNISFTAIQARNNEEFVCENGGIGCLEKADVMLVLDRSGSIDSGELAIMKTAAKAFVDSLAPSADGTHIGLATFATSASLDVHLTSDGESVKTAIDAITTGGLTNLEMGIRTADAELDNPGDGHDRADVTSPDFIVLITDGEPTASNGPGTHMEDAKDAADDAKADGIEIFAVGVGITVDNANFLKSDIVSAPPATHYFDSEDFEDLGGILENIASCNP